MRLPAPPKSREAQLTLETPKQKFQRPKKFTSEKSD
jgi:hypothetical protein